VEARHYEGYRRSDGSVGIRNHLLVIYLVECAHHVARRISDAFEKESVHLIGFPGCYPNQYAAKILDRLATHGNVGGVLLVSLGCESFDAESLLGTIRETGRPAELLTIQENGGTLSSIELGKRLIAEMLEELRTIPRQPIRWDRLVVGTICGGSDATSGLSANPAVGQCLDRFIDEGGTALFEETGELIGCERLIAARAENEKVGREIESAITKAANYYTTLGHGSFAPGNAAGGLTTIEEKSLGAYCKSGNSAIEGVLRPGESPPGKGLYLLDVVPDGPVRFGFPNIADNAEIVELISCGCHLILFTTGRGSVVGSAVSPVIKICANHETFRKLEDDMDIDAGKILLGQGTHRSVAEEIHRKMQQAASGEPTKSERLGHREFLLTYKWFREGESTGRETCCDG
jgi:altronate hydrolase